MTGEGRDADRGAVQQVGGLDAQARRWLWTFPGWTRGTAGEEAVGIVIDLCPPRTTKLSVASRVDLVRAGLHVRRREIPPWRVWSTVLDAHPRNRAGTVPERWRPWLIRRLPTASFLWWCAALRPLPILAIFAFIMVVAGSGVGSGPDMSAFLWGALAVYPLAVLAYVVVQGPGWRRTLRDRNGLDAQCRPLGSDQVAVTMFEARVPNVGAALPLAAGAAAVVFASLVNVADVGLATSGIPGSWPTLRILVSLFAPSLWAVWWGTRSRLRRNQLVEGVGDPPVVPLSRTWWRWPVRAIVAYLAPTVITVPFALVSTYAFGSIGLAGAMVLLLALVLLRQHQTGRRIGVWELLPLVGPAPRLAPMCEPGAGEPRARRHSVG